MLPDWSQTSGFCILGPTHKFEKENERKKKERKSTGRTDGIYCKLTCMGMRIYVIIDIYFVHCTSDWIDDEDIYFNGLNKNIYI